jgi:hypothetical protein
LLGEQAARRRDRGIKRRIAAAQFAEHTTLEAFDWKFNKTDISSLSPARRAANALILGLVRVEVENWVITELPKLLGMH